MLEIRQASKRFGAFTAVAQVDLHVGAREFFTLLGPSGCGKTTLLRLIAGFDLPDTGCVLLDQQDLAAVPPERRPVHTVFQSYALFPHLTVERNIAFPLEMRRVPRSEIRRRVSEALAEVALDGLGRRYPDELSGGQRQRVAIARALVDRPRLLLLDEPLGALDAKLRAQLKLELIELQKQTDISFVYVTHDQGEALALSHRIAVMNQGRIEQVATPQAIYRQPASRFVAGFIGQCNLLDATVHDVDAASMGLVVAGIGHCRCPRVPGAAVGQRGSLALRPEAITLAEVGVPEQARASPAVAGNRHAGRIRDRLYEGDVTIYTVMLDSGAGLRTMLPNADPDRACRFEAGQRVGVGWHDDAGHFLHEQAGAPHA